MAAGNSTDKHLRILVGEWKPFSSVYRNGSTRSITGFMAVFLQILRRKLSVSYTLMVSPDKAWGARVGRNWSGVIGMLNRSEGDFLASPVIASDERAEAMQLSSVLFISDAKLLVGIPKNPHFSLMLFRSIEQDVLIGMFICVVTLYAIGKIFQYILKSPYPAIPFWNLIEALFMKSPARMPPSQYGAFLNTLWSLSMFIILTAFGGEITSALSVSPVPEIIRTLDDVSHFPQVRPIVPQSGYFQWFVQQSRHPALQQCWKKVEKDASLTVPWNDYYSDKVLDQIENATHFNMGEMYTFRSQLHRRFKTKRKCAFYLSESFDSTILTLAFRKTLDMSLQRSINKILTRMMETQLLEKSDVGQDLFYTRCLWTDKHSEDVVDALPLHSFHSAFLLLGSGFAVSLFALVLEVVWTFRGERKQQKMTKNTFSHDATTVS